jgi:hypothetical protein
MPVRLAPLLDWECLIRIFEAEGFSSRGAQNGWMVFEKRGVDTAVLFRRDTFLGPTEIADLVHNADIAYMRFLELRAQLCPPDPLSPQ